MRKKHKKNPPKLEYSSQGELLLIDFASKLEAGDDAQDLIKEISTLLPRKLFKLTSANSDDKIFYIIQHLEQIEKILKSV